MNVDKNKINEMCKWWTLAKTFMKNIECHSQIINVAKNKNECNAQTMNADKKQSWQTLNATVK